MKLELKELYGWQEQSGATSIILIWVRLIKLDKNKLNEHQLIQFVLCEFKTIRFIFIRIESGI
jgi:hypothetical protein